MYPVRYSKPVSYEIQQTRLFVEWRDGLRDLRARIAIGRRLDRVQAGLLGDHKSLGDGVSELRVNVGPGYRLYYTRRKRVVIVLLCGGDKRTQSADIKRARKMAREV